MSKATTKEGYDLVMTNRLLVRGARAGAEAQGQEYALRSSPRGS
ncbi:MAG TPA: hypothetical protein VEJ84_10850 [Acidimicrobiales bacterium]|nr:hypothetical protein [Acidimicrobiales bacterium]